MDLGNFDVTKVELSNDFDLIPAGEYKAIITESNKKETASGNGVGILFKFQIIEGKFKSRTLFNWINWEHPNEMAQNIGRENLARICQAALPGVRVHDTEELHDKPMMISVKVKKNKDGVEQNNIVYYAPAQKIVVKKQQESAPWKNESSEDDVPF